MSELIQYKLTMQTPRSYYAHSLLFSAEDQEYEKYEKTVLCIIMKTDQLAWLHKLF